MKGRSGNPAKAGGKLADRLETVYVKIPDVGCKGLSGHSCWSYAIRRALCRLYGAVEGLTCDHGCRPEAGLLSKADGFRLLAEVEACT